MSNVKFFSEAWCQEALTAENAEAAKMIKSFNDAKSFSHVLAFEVSDRPGVVSQVKYVEGRPVAWTSTDLFAEDEVWAKFSASLDHYQEAASGKTPAANLVMAGKMRLVKGTMKDAVQNVKPLNLLLSTWGTIPTDWDV